MYIHTYIHIYILMYIYIDVDICINAAFRSHCFIATCIHTKNGHVCQDRLGTNRRKR